MTPETPAVADVTAKLFGEGDLTARVEYPLLSKTLDFRIEASLGPMNLPTANRFATNVTGVAPREGRIDYACGDNDIAFFELFVHALTNGLKRIVI